MIHFKNSLYVHYKLVVKFRIAIILFFSLIFLYLAITMTSMLTHNDDELWLQGSNEHKKLLENKHELVYIQKLQLQVGDDPASDDNIANLKLLHENLKSFKEIVKISSPLTHKIISFSDNQDGSSLVEAKTLNDSPIEEISKTLHDSFEEFTQFYSADKSTLYVYISSSSLIDISSIYIPFKYTMIEVTEDQNLFKDMTLFFILLSTLFILFSITFRSIIPSLLGIIFIVFTTLFTISIYKYIQPDVPLHVSILLISIAVSIMDFIYIYNGWHIMQTSHSAKRSLYSIIMKTFSPIFWATFLSVAGIGSLVFQKSIILQSIGYNIILSASIAFILSFTFLIALLSFFKLKDPYLITKNISRLFAKLEAGYNKTSLQIFFLFTGLIFIASITYVILQPSSIIEKSNEEVINIVFPSDGLTHESLQKLESFHNDLIEKFDDDIVNIISSYKYAKGFCKAYSPSEKFDVSKVNLSFISFDFNLYGIHDDVMTGSNQRVTIYIDEDGVDKNTILQWIRNWDQDNITLIDDVSSLLSAVKHDSISHMFFVVFYILFLITFVIYYITKDKVFAFIALVVNTVPLVWFFAILILLEISLSIEILIAMLIMIALSSDASIHFLYYYYKHNQIYTSNERAIESSFIEVGTPVGMGSTILLLTFALLVFANIPTISTIGIYSVVLIIFSLLADLFILPVLYIEFIKSKNMQASFKKS